MREMTDKRSARRLTGGMCACLWLAITLMALVACSDETITDTTSYTDAAAIATTTGKTLFTVGDMTRLDYDSIYTAFEDSEQVGCAVTNAASDTLLANTLWHYDIGGNYLVVDTLWQYSYDDENPTVEKKDASDSDALLTSDDDGYTSTTSHASLNLYFYYPFSADVSPDNYKSFHFQVAADQRSKDSLNASDRLWVAYKGLTYRASATAHLLFEKKNATLRVVTPISLIKAWLINIVRGKNVNLTTGEYDDGDDTVVRSGDPLYLGNNGDDGNEMCIVLPPQEINDVLLRYRVYYKTSDDSDGDTLSYTASVDGVTLNEDDLYTYTVVANESVDLGLSVRWAANNVGASSPEDYGDYYAWGETETKENYSTTNSTWYQEDAEDIAGTEYDVAHVKWGGSWRMPTEDECEELIDSCTWTWTTLNGVNGYQVTGSTGNSIFLPAAGYYNGTTLNSAGSYGYYWSSTPYGSNTKYAYVLYFYSGRRSTVWSGYRRCYGRSVRPVGGL